MNRPEWEASQQGPPSNGTDNQGWLPHLGLPLHVLQESGLPTSTANTPSAYMSNQTSRNSKRKAADDDGFKSKVFRPDIGVSAPAVSSASGSSAMGGLFLPPGMSYDGTLVPVQRPQFYEGQPLFQQGQRPQRQLHHGFPGSPLGPMEPGGPLNLMRPGGPAHHRQPGDPTQQCASEGQMQAVLHQQLLMEQILQAHMFGMMQGQVPGGQGVMPYPGLYPGMGGFHGLHPGLFPDPVFQGSFAMEPQFFPGYMWPVAPQLPTTQNVSKHQARPPFCTSSTASQPDVKDPQTAAHPSTLRTDGGNIEEHYRRTTPSANTAQSGCSTPTAAGQHMKSVADTGTYSPDTPDSGSQGTASPATLSAHWTSGSHGQVYADGLPRFPGNHHGHTFQDRNKPVTSDTQERDSAGSNGGPASPVHNSIADTEVVAAQDILAIAARKAKLPISPRGKSNVSPSKTADNFPSPPQHESGSTTGDNSAIKFPVPQGHVTVPTSTRDLDFLASSPVSQDLVTYAPSIPTPPPPGLAYDPLIKNGRTSSVSHTEAKENGKRKHTKKTASSLPDGGAVMNVMASLENGLYPQAGQETAAVKKGRGRGRKKKCDSQEERPPTFQSQDIRFQGPTFPCQGTWLPQDFNTQDFNFHHSIWGPMAGADVAGPNFYHNQNGPHGKL